MSLKEFKQKFTGIQKRILLCKSHSMEIYAIITHELLPLVELMPDLNKELMRRMGSSKSRGDSFAFLNRFLNEESFRLMYVNNEGYFPALQSEIDNVCRDLLNFIETLDDPAIEEIESMQGTQTGRTRVLYRGDHLYEYKSEHYQQKNWNYAKLSDFVYTRCRLVGSKVSVLEVFEYMRPGRDYKVAERKNWKWVFDTVAAANRWADKNKIPKLMDCKNDYIVRLGIGSHQPKRADRE